MFRTKILIAFTLLIPCFHSFSQDINIRTKEGRPILNRKQLITSCLKSLHKDRTDKTALSICECRTDILDGKFTNKQYKKYTDDGVIDLAGLLKEDSLVENAIHQCYTNTGQTTLLQAESFEDDFMNSCIKSIQKNTEKTLDINRITNFCSCQLEMVKSKKITDAEMETLSDPNSLLFYEMIYKCGDPFLIKEELTKNWNQNSEKDISGPAEDTIKTLALNGMTYVKIKIGSMAKIWLFDTGASDLLINKDMEEALKKENILSPSNYLGIGEYEMANGMIDTCRKYMISNLQVGKFSVNNIVVAITDKGKRIIVGKALLNKFSKWILNNQENKLILLK